MHSSDQVYRARGGTVYHLDPSCPSGRQIPAELLAQDSGGLPLCPACRARREAKPPSGPLLELNSPLKPKQDGGSSRGRRPGE
jgi:hypothetical protein